MKILHVVIGLEVGGAESMLFRLVQASPKQEHVVVSLTTLGKLGKKLQNQGHQVYALRLNNLAFFPVVLWRLVKLMRSIKPDVVQTWMYHSDLIGGIAARLCGIKKVFWGIRNTQVPNAIISSTRLVIWICARLSWFIPYGIVCCANSAKSAHEKLGYCLRKMHVIGNGYDIEMYANARETRENIRQQMGFSESDIIVGIVGRFDLLKDYSNFVKATDRVAENNANVNFLMVGRRVEHTNELLMTWINQTHFPDRYTLLGEREDVPSLLAVMDVFCLSSKAEGFPNVVAEAMATGVPCVVTNVGDAAKIVQNNGIIVDAENYELLAKGITELVNMSDEERRRLGLQAMDIVRENYSIQEVTKQYNDLYQM